MRERFPYNIASAFAWCFGSTRVTDDSRRTLYFSTPDDGIEQLGLGDRLAFSGWFWLGPAVGVLVLVGLQLAGIGVRFTALTMFMIVGGIVAVRRRRRDALPQLVRLRLSNGRCGACGYPLHDQAHDQSGDEDQLQKCSECGGLWTRRPTVPGAPTASYELAAARQSYEYTRDDRKKPLHTGGRKHHPARWLTAPGRAVLRASERERSEQFRGSLLLLAIIAVSAFLVTWIATTFSLITTSLTELLMALGYSSLGGIIWVVIDRLGGKNEGTDALTCGLCPACGTALDASHPEPDGCVVCAHCSCAWEAEDVGSNPIPPDPCPKCGTERAGAARCVACNDRGFGTAGVGEPSPHCARCDTILAGHDRVCPRCGVANGTVYR